MLSILIPIYNFDVCPLVEALHQQCTTLDLKFEIILFDDASSSIFYNQKLANKSHLQYVQLKENIGRSKIRNKLAAAAKYRFLLFLDCDSAVPNEFFIEKYITASEQNSVVYGGTIYNKKPINPNKALHYTFGKTREEKNAITRNISPYLSFTSNNFLIEKTLFLTTPFNEKIKGYGYEDVLFAINLKDQNQQILHIDNPVIHLGLEVNEIFLQKTKKAIENLYLLQNQNLIQSSRLIEFYNKMKRFKLINFIVLYFHIREKSILKNLNSANPKLYNLDLYKFEVYHKKVKFKK